MKVSNKALRRKLRHRLAVMTDWSEFRKIDIKKLYGLMRTPVIADARNLFNAGTAIDLGFRYKGVGAGNTE